MCWGSPTKKIDRKKEEHKENLANMRAGLRGRNESRSAYKRRMQLENRREKLKRKGQWPNSGSRHDWKN